MSIYVDDLRDVGNHHGHQICELAADEIDELENTCSQLEAECDKLKALNAELASALLAIIAADDDERLTREEIEAGRAAAAKATGESA